LGPFPNLKDFLLMSTEIKVLVLDIDGTLAKTENISNGRRTPYDILKLSPPQFSHFPLAYIEPLNKALSNIIRYGVPVVLITRAPKAYASTLLQLLGFDYSYCIPSSVTTPAEKLISISESYQIDTSSILYIGDTEEDKLESGKVDVHFEYPFWSIENEGHRNNARERSLFHKLSLLADHFEFEEENPSHEINRSNLLRAIREKEVFLNLENFQIEYNYDHSAFEIQLFNAPFVQANVITPPLNPDLFTRYEYENFLELREILQSTIRELITLPRIRPTQFNSFKSEFENIFVSSFGLYMNRFIGQDYWQVCKDFKGKASGSGPEVHLHLIEMIALIMSAFIERDEVVIPVPSSEFSQNKPGEISRRIAYRLGQLSGINTLDAFEKDIEDKFSLKLDILRPELKYVLIDDQLTSGHTISACTALIPISEFESFRVMTWTFSPGRGWLTEPAS